MLKLLVYDSFRSKNGPSVNTEVTNHGSSTRRWPRLQHSHWRHSTVHWCRLRHVCHNPLGLVWNWPLLRHCGPEEEHDQGLPVGRSEHASGSGGFVSNGNVHVGHDTARQPGRDLQLPHDVVVALLVHGDSHVDGQPDLCTVLLPPS